MSSSRLTSLPSLRRQNLLVEFAGLKQACPEGVFVSLTPGDPSLWSGVLFVRDGPYAPAVLRFQISFPDAYPSLPPLVTFSTDIFHPLITPLTNYTYTTDIQDGGTVSATDEERLPPGGFSLRHGFPAWFGRASRSRANKRLSGPLPLPPRPQTPPPRSGTGSASASAQSTPNSSAAAAAAAAASPLGRREGHEAGGSVSAASAVSVASTASTPSYARTRPPTTDVSTYDVLHYIRSTFDDETVLDSIPLEAAGNPGAWDAWHARQRQQGKTLPGTTAAPADDGVTAAPTRKPGEWSWEHVWEERVKKGIGASISEPVLYGGAGAADDVIRFLSMDESEVEAVKENLKRTLGASLS